MKITKTETVKTEIEVSLPCYRKTNCHYYKVYSEQKCLCVCDLEGHLAIQLLSSENAFINNISSDSTEEEFLLKFDEVYHNLLKL